MNGARRAITTAVFSVALMFTLCQPAKAGPTGPTVSLSTMNLGGGLFQYDFTIHNPSGPVPMAGLLVEGGNSVFGLDLSSTINAPAGWDFLSPLPPFDDLLSYFSLTPASDIPVGSSLGGLSFDSSTDPSSVSSVDVVVVGDDSEQFPYTVTPEPCTMTLLSLAGATVAIRRRWIES